MNFKESQLILEKYGLALTLEDYENHQSKLVFCGMSGGVDSSVSALLLKLQGYKVIGLFMRNWEEHNEDGVCTAEEDFKDVIKVCESLGIDYYSLDFTHEYKTQVFEEFVREYEKGNTPNPDILCNREIKFKVFYDKAMELGANYLATGHYCRKGEDRGEVFLQKGRDEGKDQSYFLYTMKNNVLRNVLFPVGELKKSVVRQIAQDFKLATGHKKDSTGICFIGERNFKEFLSRYIKSQTGEFRNLESHKVLGQHLGQCFYTVGQRKGLGIGGPGGPWFVAKKDVHDNTVYVVEGENHPALYVQQVWCEDQNISWVGEIPGLPLRCKAKIRYRQADQDCTVRRVEGGILIEFERPQRAAAVRQSIVFYAEDICLGGAIISRVGKTLFERPAVSEDYLSQSL